MSSATGPQRRKVGLTRVADTALALTILFISSMLRTGSANAQTYTEKILYKFTGVPDGVGPEGGLARDAQGNLFGLTINGGSGTCPPQPGCGTVFRLEPNGNETVLHNFGGGTDGQNPNSTTLIQDKQGNLYGTTLLGGATNPSGTVFKVDAQGNETVLFAFHGSDGSEPAAGLLLDSQGNLYGTTEIGGANFDGTVFKLDTGGNESVLYSFKGTASSDGQLPGGSLILDGQGNLYGTASGGANVCQSTSGAIGCGVVFKVDPQGNETVLYSFKAGNADGVVPDGSLVMDAHGNLYGVTNQGGTGTCQAPVGGCGTVFKLDPAGKETVLYSFTGTNGDGAFPTAGLLLDSQGNLYGTTYGEDS